MNPLAYRIALGFAAVLVLFSCRQTKYVGEGNYLLSENKILFETVEDGDTSWEKKHAILNETEMMDLVTPVTNRRLKLFFFNRIDTVRYKEQISRKKEKYSKKNKKRQDKEDRINKERIEKAKQKGKKQYKKKNIPDKKARWGWRNWVVTKLGEEPVLLDTFKVEKSDKQLEIYLKKRGFYNAEVHDTIVYKKNRKKAYVTYYVTTGDPLIISSIEIDSSSRNTSTGIVKMYDRMSKKEGNHIHVGDYLDEDLLDMEREKFAKYLGDNGFYSINKNYINFVIDTTREKNRADVTLVVKDRTVPHPTIKDSTVTLNHTTFKVNKVTFLLHNTDTNSFYNGYHNFVQRCDELGLNYKTQNRYTLLDTLHIIDTSISTVWFHTTKERQKERGTKFFEKYIDTNIRDLGYYVYNDVPYVNPYLLDKQNFLENRHWYKSYYVDRSYGTLLGLDIFSGITPVVEVDPLNPFGREVNVTYHLTPSKHQTFVFEPRATNTNSILGVSAAVSYTNRNLARGAQYMKISFVGGFESQPLIIGEEGSSENKRQGLNTFEWGPTISLRFPKLIPLSRSTQEKLSKRLYPSTTFDLAVNFQHRNEFDRRMAQFFYTWNFKSDKTQEWKFTPLGFNFVKLEKDSVFESKLIALNDPFVLNSYADHNSTLFMLEWKYDNNRLSGKYGDKHNIIISFTESGFVVNSGPGLFNIWDPNQSLKELFGVPFTQFLKVDNQYVYSHWINRKSKIACRFMAGAGYAYKNSPSLPYEQSFFAGGSNDIRAFRAKTMAPGGTRIYEDSTATITQIGDMRLELNLEYRFEMTSVLHGAIFVDMGNIWKIKDDPTTTKDDLGVFHFDSFWRQTAIGVGFGLRADLDYLVVRGDFSFAIHNPYLPAGEKWVGSTLTEYRDYFDVDNNGVVDVGPGKPDLPWINPYPLVFNFGIGYPF